ncbi:HAD-superfamily hydrolase [Ascoidea rubescens DSM 1968]|uniref:HAD-superfamily hydrolase n=1 Tax=Ascoidea rubescens DSM 1968 TaxID=1344418 RepID=A0A1D2VL18_9ASCO|nr:HAD-superfamily hydrolase [Ascoidea rubescens DSM 1968]ODV62289.1 HAD-superfamily hydrolase [Ascoidea rubescens DSM 1968]
MSSITSLSNSLSNSFITDSIDTAKTTPMASPAMKPNMSYSYLNNDNIDQMQPLPRKEKVSSLSLSDQWNYSSLTRLNSSIASRSRSSSIISAGISRNTSINKSRIQKKLVIDHQRVASYAFCFDIDGVIVKGPETIPEAKTALKMLNGDNPYNIKVPYIFVTNGGGRSEKARCQDLSKRLNVPVAQNQVIQGHTPMKDLINVFKTVLVVGGVGNDCRNVALEYGFEDVVTPLDIMKWNPSVTPYHTLTEQELKFAEDRDFNNVKIDAILVFADSRNWAADQQIILELLLSRNGYMGTASDTFDQGPGLFFAHSDFVWATNYKLSRYGMGALQVSIAALYREHTGKELKVTRFGKPQRGTFRYTSKVLTNWRKDVLEEHVDNTDSPFISDISDEDEDDYFSTSDTDDEPLTVQALSGKLKLDIPPASTVYFVGDTPESDIRFANSHDASWFSILVKTGVYQNGTVPRYQPKHTCENVLEAVQFAIEREHEKELAEWNLTMTRP